MASPCAEILFRSFDSGLMMKKARGMQLISCWLNELKELHKGNVDMIFCLEWADIQPGQSAVEAGGAIADSIARTQTIG